MLKIRIDRRAVPQPRHRATRGGRMYLPTSAPVRAFKAAIRERALAAITRATRARNTLRIIPISFVGPGRALGWHISND